MKASTVNPINKPQHILTDAEYKKRFVELCVEMAVRMVEGEQEQPRLKEVRRR